MAAPLQLVRYRGCIALQCHGSARLQQVLTSIAKDVDSAWREDVEKRDGAGNVHLTVVDPQECTPALEDQFLGVQVTEGELCILGLGAAQGCTFAVVHCSRLQHARLIAGLPAKDFHITLGFRGADQHDVSKGLHSVRTWSADGGWLASCLEKDNAAMFELQCKPSVRSKLRLSLQQVAHAAGGQDLYTADQRRRLLEISLRSAYLCNLDSAVTESLSQEVADFDPVSPVFLWTKFAMKKGILEGKAASDHVHSELRGLPTGTAFDERLAWLAQEARAASLAEDTPCAWGRNDAGELALLKLPLNCAPVLGTDDKLWGSGCPSKSSLRAIAQLNINRIVTLTEDPLSCKDDSNDFQQLHFCHFPIRDRHAPESLKSLLTMCRSVQHGLAQARSQRGGVLVHCVGGKGRTALVLAGILMLEECLNPSAALAQLKVNRRVLVTEEQVRMLKQLYAATSVRAMRPLSGAAAGPLPKTLPRIMVLCGLPGAGKSTLCQELVRKFPSSVRHINQDELGAKETEEAWSTAAMSAARGEKIVAILDKCNLKQEDRKSALACLDPSSRAQVTLVHFSLGVEACAERAAARTDHVGEVTGERARRIVRKMGETCEVPQSAKAEGVGALHSVQDDDAVSALLRSWGCGADEPELQCVVGFPRTRHLKNLGAATDDDVQVEDPSPFLMKQEEGDYITVEEKIDGANLGLRLDEDGHSIVAQNRSHIVNSKYHAQFQKLDKWVADHSKTLRRVLRDRNLILYGEWVYALHSTSYDQLPGYFIAFDLRCVLTDMFVSRSELQAMLQGTGISLTPLLLSKPSVGTNPEAKSMFKTVLDLVHRQSSFAGDTPAEGVYVRVQRGSWTVDRAKIVRPHFIAGNERWNKGEITINELTLEARERLDADRDDDAPLKDDDVAPIEPAAEKVEFSAGASSSDQAPSGQQQEMQEEQMEANQDSPGTTTPEAPELFRATSRQKEVLRWLSGQLSGVLSDSHAEGLMSGLGVILADDETPAEEVIESIVSMLNGEGVPESIVQEFSERAATLLL